MERVVVVWDSYTCVVRLENSSWIVHHTSPSGVTASQRAFEVQRTKSVIWLETSEVSLDEVGNVQILTWNEVEKPLGDCEVQ